MAVTARALTTRGPLDERAGQHDTESGDLGQDLAAALLWSHRVQASLISDLDKNTIQGYGLPILFRREVNVVRAASRFCDHQGLSAPISEEIIEAFVQQGLSGLQALVQGHLPLGAQKALWNTRFSRVRPVSSPLWPAPLTAIKNEPSFTRSLWHSEGRCGATRLWQCFASASEPG